MPHLTQADWIAGSPARLRLFEFVCDQLNWQAGRLDFEVQDDITGPLIRHNPTGCHLGVRPSLPANERKPFDVWVRLTHRFPVTAAGAFNVKLVVQRVREVTELQYPEFP